MDHELKMRVLQPVLQSSRYQLGTRKPVKARFRPWLEPFIRKRPLAVILPRGGGIGAEDPFSGSVSEGSGINSKRSEDLYLKVRARIWP